jgi:hypothetical protein
MAKLFSLAKTQQLSNMILSPFGFPLCKFPVFVGFWFYYMHEKTQNIGLDLFIYLFFKFQLLAKT